MPRRSAVADARGSPPPLNSVMSRLLSRASNTWRMNVSCPRTTLPSPEHNTAIRIDRRLPKPVVARILESEVCGETRSAVATGPTAPSATGDAPASFRNHAWDRLGGAARPPSVARRHSRMHASGRTTIVVTVSGRGALR